MFKMLYIFIDFVNIIVLFNITQSMFLSAANLLILIKNKSRIMSGQ